MTPRQNRFFRDREKDQTRKFVRVERAQHIKVLAHRHEFRSKKKLYKNLGVATCTPVTTGSHMHTCSHNLVTTYMPVATIWSPQAHL
jgi:exonuclease I